MNESAQKYLRIAGYLAFFLLALLVSISISFPYEKAKDRIVAMFNSQQKSTTNQQELHIDKLSGYWLTGVRAEGVHILSSPTPGKPPAEIKIDEARARLQLLPLLIMNKNIGFSLDLMDGEIDGLFGDHGSERVIDLTFDGVELGKVGPVQQALGLPLTGKLFGTINLVLPLGKASKGNGKVSLELRELALGDGKSKVNVGMGDGLSLEKLNVGTLTIEGEAKDGVLKFSKIQSSGKDLELSGEGKVQMKELANDSIVDVMLKLKVNDSYKNKNDKTKGMFALLDVAPDTRAAKMADGFFGVRLAGPLGKLKPTPAGSGGGGTGFSAAKKQPRGE